MGEEIPLDVILRLVPDIRLRSVSKDLKNLYDDESSDFKIRGKSVKNSMLPSLVVAGETLKMKRRVALGRFERYGLLQNLTSLSARYLGLTDLAFLRGCSALTSLDLQGNELTSLHGLAEFERLEELDVAYNVDLRDISGMRGCSRLKWLDLHEDHKISCVDDIPPGLERLTLSHCVDIRALKNLKSIDARIRRSGGGDMLLHAIAGCAKLECLALSGGEYAVTDTEFAFLQNLNLRKLDIYDTGIEAIPPFPLLVEARVPLGFTDVRGLALCTALKSLYAEGDLYMESPFDSDMYSSWLATHWHDAVAAFFPKQLEELHIRFNALDDLELVRSLPNLKILDIYGCKIASRSLEPLCTCSRLEELSVGQLWWPADIDLSPVASLTRLKRLTIQCADLSILGALTELTHLNLMYSEARDLSPIRHLPSVEHLDLRGSDIEDLAPLRAWTSLKTIELNDLITDVSALGPGTRCCYPVQQLSRSMRHMPTYDIHLLLH